MVLSNWINIIGWELALVYSHNWFGSDLVFRYDNFVLWKFAQTISNKSSQPGVNYVKSFTTLPTYCQSQEVDGAGSTAIQPANITLDDDWWFALIHSGSAADW